MVQKSEGRGRGRPRSYDPDAALAAARDAFWEAGYSATSLDDLAAATGMNRPSLYAAFGDKHSLYLAALKGQAEGMLAATRAGLAFRGDLKATLANFYSRAVDLYIGDRDSGRGCFLVGTALADAVSDVEVRAVLRESFEQMDTLMAERLQRAVVDGDLPADADVPTLTYVAMSALHGLAIRSRAGFSREALGRLANAAATAVCG
ncbi:TetR family transcriptional regulator [Caulobacter mirabilis]|uniref:TetR family transcriptional regulator n=1 Tax=Caulobacter mirabilis TaxID=69666 RepID=A0A2D2AW01_9CAUL|nr:TetR family transcriptional regulator [Caulobacter mirabilis]